MKEHRQLIARLEESHGAILAEFGKVLEEHGISGIEVTSFNVAPGRPGEIRAATALAPDCPPGEEPRFRCRVTGTGIRCGWECE